MPRRSVDYKTPKHWVVSGTWPDAVFRDDTPDIVAYAAELARRLEKALAGKSKTTVAAEAALTRPTIYDILAGNSWSDMITIARLESVLGAELWPASPPPLRRESDTD